MRLWVIEINGRIEIHKNKKPTKYPWIEFKPEYKKYSTVMTEYQMKVLKTLESQEHLVGVSFWGQFEHGWTECLVAMTRFLKHRQILKFKFHHGHLWGDHGLEDWFEKYCLVENDFYISFSPLK